MEFFLLTVLTNILFVAAGFVWVWFVAGKNKTAFAEKFNTLDKKIDGIDGEMSVSINANNDFSENLLTELKLILPHINDLKQYINETNQEVIATKELSKKASEQHEEFHDGMLGKLNLAGELIVGYESFYENSLVELEDLSRFVDLLSKRPAVSNDPDFTSFVRAVQVMVQILSKYSTVANDLKRESQAIKTD